MTGDAIIQEFPARRPEGGSIDHVALVTLNRPEALNALSRAAMGMLVGMLETLDADPDCRVIVIRGAGTRAFAAGADIREMADATAVDLSRADPFALWDQVAAIRKPLIAAVRGFALGGGCELAMACDMIVAGEDARFGQPETRLGIIPGAGGTQRLTRAIGKSRAMEMILTGRTFTAHEAEQWGLVSRVVPAEETVSAALELAATVAAMAPLAVLAAKEAVNLATELPLTAGIAFERRAFFLLFASDDQKEGMRAFLEKRPPDWAGR